MRAFLCLITGSLEPNVIFPHFYLVVGMTTGYHFNRQPQPTPNTMNSTNQQKPCNFRRELPDSHPYRRIVVTMKSGTFYQWGHEHEGYIVTSHHDCWTGAEWLPITNSDEFFNYDDAVKCAREMVARFR